QRQFKNLRNSRCLLRGIVLAPYFQRGYLEDVMLRTFLVLSGFALFASEVHAIPTTIYENYSGDPDYPVNVVGGYNAAPGNTSWHAELLHSFDVETGHYNMTPTTPGGGVYQPGPPILSAPIDGFFTFDGIVQNREFQSGAVVLAGAVPAL